MEVTVMGMETGVTARDSQYNRIFLPSFQTTKCLSKLFLETKFHLHKIIKILDIRHQISKIKTFKDITKEITTNITHLHSNHHNREPFGIT
ncbi:hypothetical protein GCM10007893_28830 [Paracoccus marinus]|nr:hypothetical protein GCM10007893_28830 [Paracoccus marinus]